MKISYEDLMYCEFIEELKRQKQIVLKREDLEIKKRILEEIADAEVFIKDAMEGQEDYVKDTMISEYQEFVAEKIIEYYNEISEKFQKTYAIFENQIAKVKKGKLFKFSAYPKIEAMNNAVNVMKHGKEGRSYKALKEIDSKYLHTPTEFLSLDPEMPAKLMLELVEYKCSSALLNLEYPDIIEFLDEAITAWADFIQEIHSSKGI